MHHFMANSNYSYRPETLNSGENRSFLSRVTLKFDGWPWKTIGNLFYATSSFVLHSIAFSKFKLELQSGNAQFGSKSAFFSSSVTLKCDGWPWKTKGYLFYATSSFVHHFTTIGEFKLELQSRNAQFWVEIGDFWFHVTLKFDGWPWKIIWAPLPYYFKLCASFHNHRLIQTRVTVWKRPIWVKIGDFSFRVTLKFDGWPWKTTWHLFYATSSFVFNFIAICESKLELLSGNGQIEFWPLWPWPLTLTFSMDISLL